MIFVCVGSREYHFNRLLKEIDHLIEKEVITEKVFGQIGQSDYLPKNYKYERFIDQKKFEKYQQDASIIISHGGTGALIGALKKGKKVIAVPRLSKFGEHIDDHQVEVSSALESQGYLKKVINIEDLEKTIKDLKKINKVRIYDRESNVLNIITKFIKNN